MSKSELLKQAAESRGLAEQGRRLAPAFKNPEDRARATEYVEEMEATAVRLQTEAETLE
jgi:hypothetical protein